LAAKEERSAGRRGTVIKPALGTKIRRWDDYRDSKDGRPRRLKKGETGSWRRPLKSVAKKALLLDIRRMGSYRRYLLDFGTERSVTSRKAGREGAYG
jgi:hypothetical protein